MTSGPPDPPPTADAGIADQVSRPEDDERAWGAAITDPAWLQRFWDGDRAVLDELCRQTFTVVDGAVSRYLHGADRDTGHDIGTGIRLPQGLECAILVRPVGPASLENHRRSRHGLHELAPQC